jgi:hypothetical protein
MRLRALGVLLVVLAALSAAAGPIYAKGGNTHYVSSSPVGSDKSCASPGFNSIQAAVTASTAGATIKICAGTYAEQVVIGENLTIKGAGAASTTVTYPASPAAASGTCADSSSLGLQAYPIVQICGGKTKMSGLTIAGPFPVSDGCGAQPQGIFVGGGATLNISSSHIASIRQSDSGLFGCQGGVGLQVGRDALSQVGTSTVQTVTVSDYQKAGIVVDGAGSSLNVSSSTVLGPGSPSQLASAIAMNGVQVSRGASGTISNVTISGNECDAGACGSDPESDSQSCGVLLYNPGNGTTAKGSVFSGNDIGICNEEDAGSVQPQVSSDTISNNRDEGILLDSGNLKATSNSISGGNIGLSVIVYDGQGQGAGGTFTSGKITGTSTAAIEVDTDNVGTMTPHLSATLNDLSGNSGAGVVNNTSTPIDVTRNWWGDSSGPSDWSIGSGASVSANADFFPWALTSSVNTFRTCDAGPSKNINDDNGTTGYTVLCGTGKNDFIQETGPNPVLILGNGGNDQLIGGSGNDSIIGGSGNDFLNGGAGSDHGQGRGGTNTCLNLEFSTGC